MIKSLLRFAVLFFLFLLVSCKKELPTETEEIPKGVYIQKIVYSDWESEYDPQIIIADLYDDSGIFKLYNKKILNKGLGSYLTKDQQWIFYRQLRWNLPPVIRRVKIDGSDDKEITVTPDDLFIQDISISPDNSTLAILAGGLFEGLSVGIIPAEGGTYKKLFDPAWAGVAWSEDSKTIYAGWGDGYNHFGHNQAPLVKSYIIAINTDGTDFRFISDTLNGFSDDMEPATSPDGNYIAFASKRSHPEIGVIPEIFIMDKDGGNVQRLTTALISEKKGDHYDYVTFDSKPVFLNDGQHIIFLREYAEYDYSVNQYKYSKDLHIVNKDGSGFQNLTNNGVSSLYKD